jgi:hypothetical protein
LRSRGGSTSKTSARTEASTMRAKRPHMPTILNDSDPDQPQRHRDTEKTQRRRDAETQRRKARKKRRGAEARRRPEATRSPGEVSASGRPGTTGPSDCSERKRSSQPLDPSGLRSRGAQAPPLTLISCSRSSKVRLRRDRRAIRLRPWATPGQVGASAGGKSDRDGCLHPERSGFSPGAGDHRIAGVTADPLEAISSTPASPLCAFASLRLCVGFRGRVALCILCVSVPLWFSGRAV